MPIAVYEIAIFCSRRFDEDVRETKHTNGTVLEEARLLTELKWSASYSSTAVSQFPVQPEEILQVCVAAVNNVTTEGGFEVRENDMYLIREQSINIQICFKFDSFLSV